MSARQWTATLVGLVGVFFMVTFVRDVSNHRSPRSIEELLNKTSGYGMVVCVDEEDSQSAPRFEAVFGPNNSRVLLDMRKVDDHYCGSLTFENFNFSKVKIMPADGQSSRIKQMAMHFRGIFPTYMPGRPQTADKDGNFTFYVAAVGKDAPVYVIDKAAAATTTGYGQSSYDEDP